MSVNPNSESLGVTKSHFSVLSSSNTNTPARRYNARHLGIANTWKSLYANLHAHRNERCKVRLPVINLDLIYMTPPQPKMKFLYFQSTVYKPFLFPVTSPPPNKPNRSSNLLPHLSFPTPSYAKRAPRKTNANIKTVTLISMATAELPAAL